LQNQLNKSPVPYQNLNISRPTSETCSPWLRCAIWNHWL